MRAAAMPIDMEKALLFAKNRSELYGKRDNGLSWTERARAKVQSEVLTGAPDDVVAEFNREVNLGGKSKDEL